jgi:hypothetical protein
MDGEKEGVIPTGDVRRAMMFVFLPLAHFHITKEKFITDSPSTAP